MAAGLTLDSGALIAVERRNRDVMALLKATIADRITLTVPAVVLAEVWRGGARSAPLARTLVDCFVEPVDEAIARSAGAALGRAHSDQTIDSLVMASAARRGDRVLTSDPEDLERFRACFPKVRVVAL
jgi:predicted nucleic acid-binding protein